MKIVLPGIAALAVLLMMSCKGPKESASSSTSSAENANTTETHAAESDEGTLENKAFVTATVSDEFKAEGCDWILVVQTEGASQKYSPVELGAAYQKDGLLVKVSYHLSRSPSKCSGANPIVIDAIKKVN